MAELKILGGEWIRQLIDPVVLEGQANEAYRTCFHISVPNPGKEATDNDKANLNKCMARFADSYKVVARSMVDYLLSTPKPKDFGSKD